MRRIRTSRSRFRANAQPTMVKQFKDWGVYSSDKGEQTVCDLLARVTVEIEDRTFSRSPRANPPAKFDDAHGPDVINAMRLGSDMTAEAASRRGKGRPTPIASMAWPPPSRT
jgi:hypothetical protein